MNKIFFASFKMINNKTKHKTLPFLKLAILTVFSNTVVNLILKANNLRYAD